MKQSFCRMIFVISIGLLFCSIAATAQVFVQWDKTIGGSEYDRLSDAIPTEDGGYLLSGLSSSPASGDKTQDRKGEEGNMYDYWIVKTDEKGNKQWDKTYGGSRDDSPTRVITTADGGYLLAGYSNSPASGDKTQDRRGGCNEFGTCVSDYWIVKVDENGNKQWDKTYGGSNNDFLTHAISTADGGYLLFGNSYSPASGDKTEDRIGEIDFWIVKIDGNGNKQWDKVIGGSENDFVSHAIPTEDGGYLLFGDSFSNASGDKTQDSKGGELAGDYWIVKIDEHGNKQWDKTIGGSGDDSPTRVITTPDGGYLLSGDSNSPASGDKTENNKGHGSTHDYWIVKVDGNGNKIWDRTFGGSRNEELANTIPTTDGGYLLAGTSTSPASGDKTEDCKGYQFGGCRFDYWIVKIDEHGIKQWDKTFGGSNDDFSPKIITTPDGGYLLAGSSRSSASGDKGHDSKGELDYWIVKVIEGEETFSIRSLSLMNTDIDEVIAQLQDGDQINLSELSHPHLTVKANTDPVNIEKVSFELEGPLLHTQTEHYYPYALFGDEPKAGGGREYTGKQWLPGEYTLTVIPYLNGQAGAFYTVSFSVIDNVSASVDFFVLVNADTDQDISRLSDGDVIDLSAIGHPSLSIRANTTPIKIDKIELSLSGPLSHNQKEQYWPYALFGDEPDGPRDYTGRDWPEGNYTLTATPYVNNEKGATATISFSVTGSNSNARLAAYPVPTTGVVNISYQGRTEQAQMLLLDFTGQPLLTLPLKEQTQLDMSIYKKGIYYLKVVDNEGVQLKRVVVE